MSSQVNRVISTGFHQLRRLKSIRRSLPGVVSRTLIADLVLTRCDSQNGLLAGITQGQTDRLQRVLNSSARLIFGASRTAHFAPMLRDKLHWLRIRERIVYKLGLTVHNALHQRSPIYVKELNVHASRNSITSKQ